MSESSDAPKTSRRRLLKAAVASAVLASAGSLVALVRSRYEVSANLVGLSPSEYVVVAHLARRVCAADAPGVVTPDDTDVAGFVDAYTAKMPKKLRRDLGRFLVFVEQ